jgi:two-component system chemotaxis response regulator CheY
MKKCLIVDDSRIVRSITSKILIDLEFEPLEAENGALALDACRDTMPDVILMDWHMPVMDGMECLQHLRAMPDGDKPVVVFCTTENDIERISQAVNAGANEFIMKPFDGEIMRSKLESVGML